MTKLLKASTAFILSITLLISLVSGSIGVYAAQATPQIRDGEYNVPFKLLKNNTADNSYAMAYVDDTVGKLIVTNGVAKLHMRFNNYDWFNFFGTLKPGGSKTTESAAAASEYNQVKEIELSSGNAVRGNPAESKTVEGYYGVVELDIPNVFQKTEVLMHIELKDLYNNGQPFTYNNWYAGQIEIDTSGLPFVVSHDGVEGPDVTIQQLTEQIEAAELLYANSEDGYWDGAYIPGARNTLQLEIVEATQTTDNPDASQENINNAYYKLINVLQQFSQYIVTVDKAALQAAIQHGEEVQSSLGLFVNIDGVYVKDAYPTSNQTSIPIRLQTADEVNSDVRALQENVDKATLGLNDTINLVQSAQYKERSARVIVLDSVEATAQLSEKAELFDTHATILQNNTKRQHVNVTLNAPATNFVSESIKSYRSNVDGTSGFNALASLPLTNGIDSEAGKYSMQLYLQTSTGASAETTGIVKYEYSLTSAPEVIETVYLSFNGLLLDQLNANIADAATRYAEGATLKSTAEVNALKAAVAIAQQTGEQLSASRVQIALAASQLQQAVDTYDNVLPTDPGNGSNPPQPNTLADGKYTLQFRILKQGTSQNSVMDEYMAHPGRLLVQNGVKYVQLLMKQSNEITAFTVNGVTPTTIESNASANTRRVQFEVEDLNQKLNGWVKIDWPAVNYFHEYDIQIELGSYVPVSDWGTETFGNVIIRDNPGTDTEQEETDEETKDGETTEGNGNGGTQQPSTSFSDASGHWAQASIERAVNLGIVNGYENGAFQPNQAINRVQWTAIIVRALQLENKSSNTVFTDQDDIQSWAKPFIQTAINAGIVTGYEDDTFRPAKAVTRSEMVVMIVKALGLPLENASELSFTDADKIPSYAKAYVATAVKHGLITGKNGNLFDGSGSATRAEAVTLILRAVDSKEQK